MCDLPCEVVIDQLQGHPFCSEACILEFNALSDEDKHRWLDCQEYLYSEACC